MQTVAHILRNLLMLAQIAKFTKIFNKHSFHSKTMSQIICTNICKTLAHSLTNCFTLYIFSGRFQLYVTLLFGGNHLYVAEMQPYANGAIGSKPVDCCLQLYLGFRNPAKLVLEKPLVIVMLIILIIILPLRSLKV